MLRAWPLLGGTVYRNGLRASFAGAAIVTSFALFGALETVRLNVDRPLIDDRLILVRGRIGELSQSHVELIESLQGVASAVGVVYMPIQGPSPRKASTIGGVDGHRLLATFPSLRAQLATDAQHAWTDTRIAALCDTRAVADHHWEVGQQIALPLLPGMLTRSGEGAIDATLVGTFAPGTVPGDCVVHSEYLVALFPTPPQFSNIFVQASHADSTADLARQIDNAFRTAAAPTESSVVNAYARMHSGNRQTFRVLIVSTLGATFFTMVLITAAAFAQSVRERLHEMAVLSAIGFSSRILTAFVAVEALLAFIVCGGIGLILGFLVLRESGYALAAPTEQIAMEAAFLMIAFAALTVAMPCGEIHSMRVAPTLQRR